jgi:drug/metabolite transporter (DMT)-like permease
MTLAERQLPAASPSRLALALLILGAVLISFSGIFVKVSELGPQATGFYRLAFAFPVFWLWQRWSARDGRGEADRPRSLADLWLLALPGLLLAGDFIAWHWGIRLTNIANPTLFGNTAPIWVTLALWLLWGQRFRPGFLVGMALAIGGIALILGASFETGRDDLVGDLLGIVTGMFYGGYMLALKAARQRFSTAAIMSWGALAGALLILAVTLAVGESLVIPSWHALLILVALSLVSQLGGTTMISWAFAHLPAAFSAVTLLMNPVVTAILAWVLLGEALGWGQIAAGLLVLGGILVAWYYSPSD